jgi:peptidoglycan/xylan/chitin deacetylase (PgdA/CDA1 family)
MNANFLSVLKSLLSLKLLPQPFTSKKIIVVYHHINEEPVDYYYDGYSTSLNNFKKQIDFFVNNFDIVSLGEISQSESANKKNNRWKLAITFDDGFYSVYKNALPILNLNNLPFAIFLNKRAIEDDQLWVSNLILKKNDLKYLKFFWSKIIDINKCSFEKFIESPINSTIVFGIFNENLFETYFNNGFKERVYLNEEVIEKLLNYPHGISLGNHTCDHIVLNVSTDDFACNQIKANHDYLQERFSIRISDFSIPFGKKEHYNIKNCNFVINNLEPRIYTSNPMRILNSDYQKNIFPRIVLTDNSLNEIIFYLNRTLLKNYHL